MMRTLRVPFLSSVRSSYAAVTMALGAVVLFGCPIYSGGGGGSGDVVCDSQGNCCDESSGNCYVVNCDLSQECPGGSTCSSNGFCVGVGYDGGGYYTPDSGTEDGSTQDATTDCSTTGCQAGFTCTVTNGTAQCLPSPDGSVALDGGHRDSGHAHDAGVDAFTLPPFTGCTNNSQCTAEAGAGAACLDGQCVAAANQCFDSTQCPFVNNVQEECVQGVCTPACTDGSCPAGYSCDTSTSVCTGNPTPCGAADGGAACAKGTTCVDEHCVPDCNRPDGGGGDAPGTCSISGDVCVDNGCIPQQTPVFVCAGADGTRSTCAASSICLHHNCYIACEVDAGADGGNSCAKADNFNVCKPVTTSSGTYDVCGSSTNLGNECNPTEGQNCLSPAICIDGYCR